MEKKTADTASPAALANLGLEIVSDTIAIECMLCQVIDNDSDIDWMEYVLFHVQHQTQSIETVMARDIPELCAHRVALLSYSHAMAAICLQVINDGDDNKTKSEAILTATRLQLVHAEALMSAIAEL